MKKRGPYGKQRNPPARRAERDEFGLTARERNMILGTGRTTGLRREAQSRGFRALRTVCATLGINPLATQQLRGAAMQEFQQAWTEEMKRLARTEPGPFPWCPAWDGTTRLPLYDFQRGRHHREQAHDTAA